MAVVGSAERMAVMPEGSFTLGKNTIRVPYRVVVDSRNDGPLTVVFAPGLPALYSTYAWGNEFHTGMRLKQYDPKPIGDAATLAWRVDCIYETPDPKELGLDGNKGTGRDQDGAFTNPLLEWPSVKTRSSGREALVERIYDNTTGTFKPMTASNGEVFDPPPKYLETYFTLEISRNESITSPHLATEALYTNTINSDTFWGIAAYYWRISDISCERQDRQIPNSPFKFPYLRCTYSFEYNPRTWIQYLLDYGSYYWKRQPNASLAVAGNLPAARVNITTADGHPTSAPLNGRGQPLPDRMPYTPVVQATPDASNKIVSIAANSNQLYFSDDDAVLLSGIPSTATTRPVAPSGLSYGTQYYVRDWAQAAGVQTFNLATTPGGARLPVADTGTGWQYIYSPGVFNVLYPYNAVAFASLGLPQSFALVQ